MNCRAIFALSALFSTAAHSQSLLAGGNRQGPIHLLPSDAAILETNETRNDLSCIVKPIAPQLGFDLRYHAGYQVTVPLQELAGEGNVLTAIFRVRSESPSQEPVYFHQEWSVPPVTAGSRGKAELEGTIVLGEGKYLVDWLLRDRAERTCSMQWPVAVDARGRDKHVALAIGRGIVEPDVTEPYGVEPSVNRKNGQSLKVLILFHASPKDSESATIDPKELAAQLSILRRIAREPRIGAYSLVVFNLDQASVLYRSQDTPQLDFPGLGSALKKLHFGTVEVQQLRTKDGEGDFLGKLVTQETERTRPDALIFVGRKLIDNYGLGRPLKKLDRPPCPVFYLTYTPDPILNPWRDKIASLVKLWKGSEYIISKPPDLFQAWAEVISRITNGRAVADASDSSLAVSGLAPNK